MALYRAGAAGVIHIVESDPKERMALLTLAESGQRRAVGYERVDDFLVSYRDGGVGCLVVDMSAAPRGVAGLRAQLAERMVQLPVVCVMKHADVTSAVAAMKEGAVDFLDKPVDRELFIAGVDDALSQDRERREAQAVRQHAGARLSSLTDREKAILRLVLSGMSSREIGQVLGIATKTVEAHRGRINAKTSAHSMPELVRLAVAAGMVEEIHRQHEPA